MAKHRHKRQAVVRRPTQSVLVAAPIAVVMTMAVVTAGVLGAGPTTTGDILASPADARIAIATARHSDMNNRRGVVVSRSQVRSTARAVGRALRESVRSDALEKVARREAEATRRAVSNADSKLWTTEDLNLWDASTQDAAQVGLVRARRQVLVTGRREAGRVEVVLGGAARWVTAAYLSEDKPPKPEPVDVGPSLGDQCSNGTSIDAGRQSLYDIYNAVCSNWPEVTSYGTWRSDGEHGQGRAMDIMVSGATGWEVANFLRANYAALGIEYLIHARNIWSVDRAGEGWRGMSDRGSITANHLDHVHVTVY